MKSTGLGEGHDRTPYPQNPSSFMGIYLLDIKSGIPLSFDYGSVIILVLSSLDQQVVYTVSQSPADSTG